MLFIFSNEKCIFSMCKKFIYFLKPLNLWNKDQVLNSFEEAFNVWSKYANLKFFKVDNGPGDIEIRYFGC